VVCSLEKTRHRHDHCISAAGGGGRGGGGGVSDESDPPRASPLSQSSSSSCEALFWSLGMEVEALPEVEQVTRTRRRSGRGGQVRDPHSAPPDSLCFLSHADSSSSWSWSRRGRLEYSVSMIVEEREGTRSRGESVESQLSRPPSSSPLCHHPP
jgi:hypothetical protein